MDIRSVYPHLSFLSPLVPNSPVTNTFLYSSPCVYDTPSFEAAWLGVYVDVNKGTDECVCMCVFTSLGQLSCGEYISVSVCHYQSCSMRLHTLWVLNRLERPEQVWSGHASVCQLFFFPRKIVCRANKERESVWEQQEEKAVSHRQTQMPLFFQREPLRGAGWVLSWRKTNDLSF